MRWHGRSMDEPGRSTRAWAWNHEYFSLMCGVGMDAHIVDRTSLRLKKWIGKLAYVLQGLRELAACVPRRYKVEIDGTEVVEAASVIVAKSRFYGGEFQLAPRADLGKPELQICFFLRGGRMSTLLYIIGMGIGHLDRMQGYRIVAAKAVRITGHDGDPASPRRLPGLPPARDRFGRAPAVGDRALRR